MESRLDVVTLAVADLERGRSFYRSLGLESKRIAMFKLEGGLLLNLYPRTDLARDAAIPVGPPQSGEFSLAQLVRSREEVDALLEKASACATVTPGHDRPIWVGIALPGACAAAGPQ